MTCEGEMGRDVARRDGPPFPAVRTETVERTRRHVILSIGDEDFAGRGIDRDAVRNLDLGLGAVCDEKVSGGPLGTGVEYRVRNGVRVGQVAPLRAVDVERVAAQGHLAVGQQVQNIGHLVRPGVDDVGPGGSTVVVPARGDGNLTVGRRLHPVEVERDLYLVRLAERLQVDL